MIIEPRVEVRSLFSCAGVLGVGGVLIGAAGTHQGGGDLARLSSMFLLIHAAAVTGLASAAWHSGNRWPVIAGGVLAIGSGFFSADLASVAFAGRHLVPFLAPAGGSLLIAGWILILILPWVGIRARMGSLSDRRGIS